MKNKFFTLFLILVFLFSLTNVHATTITRDTDVGYLVIESRELGFFEKLFGARLAINVSPGNPIVGQEVTVELLPELQCVENVLIESAEVIIEVGGVTAYQERFEEHLNVNPCSSQLGYSFKFFPTTAGDYTISLQVLGSDGGFLGQDFTALEVTVGTPAECQDDPTCGEHQWQTRTVENNCRALQVRICQEYVDIGDGQCELRSKGEEQREITLPNCSQEICDGADNNKDGRIDENPSQLCEEGKVCLGTKGCVNKPSPGDGDGFNTKGLIIPGIIIIVLGIGIYLMFRKRGK